MPKNKPPHATATLTAPAHVVAGENFTLTGTGYTPGVQAWVGWENAGARGWLGATVDGAGNLTCSDTIWESGVVTFTSSQDGRFLASCTITIT